MDKVKVIKTLFGQYYDCHKITKTDKGIITDEQRAISENNFNRLAENFFSALEQKPDASDNTLHIPDVMDISIADINTAPVFTHTKIFRGHFDYIKSEFLRLLS